MVIVKETSILKPYSVHSIYINPKPVLLLCTCGLCLKGQYNDYYYVGRPRYVLGANYFISGVLRFFPKNDCSVINGK